MKLTAKKCTENICEDFGAQMHRWVIRLQRKGVKYPINVLSDKSGVPHSRTSDMYYGAVPRATMRQMGALSWAAGELLKDDKR